MKSKADKMAVAGYVIGSVAGFLTFGVSVYFIATSTPPSLLPLAIVSLGLLLSGAGLGGGFTASYLAYLNDDELQPEGEP